MAPEPLPGSPTGKSPKSGDLVYFGMRVTNKAPLGSNLMKPNWTLPGGMSSSSLLRWTALSKEYEIFADIYWVSWTQSGSTALYNYAVKYWYTEIEKKTRQGILPKNGSPRKTLAFSGGYAVTGSSSVPGGGPTMGDLRLPGSIQSAELTPWGLGWDGTSPGKGPGARNTGPTGSTPAEPTTGTDNTGNTDTPENEPSKRLKGYKTQWNPPLIRFASGAYVSVDRDPRGRGGRNVDPTETTSRDFLLGGYNYTNRIARKGWIAQDTRWSADWNTYGDTAKVSPKDQKKVTWDKDSLILDPKVRYGFRFHYNPGQLSFGMGSYDNINPAVLLTSSKSVMPITPPENAPTVNLEIVLNRTEDLAMISRQRGGSRGKEKVSYSFPTGSNPYGFKDTWTTNYHLSNIAKKGTMWDLEFLFRTCLGKPLPTNFRGDTADLGIFFGVPIIVHLSDNMTYLGRMTTLGYVHTSFNQDMVPMLTSVSMTITRLPDAKQWTPKKPDGGKK